MVVRNVEDGRIGGRSPHFLTGVKDRSFLSRRISPEYGRQTREQRGRLLSKATHDHVGLGVARVLDPSDMSYNPSRLPIRTHGNRALMDIHPKRSSVRRRDLTTITV